MPNAGRGAGEVVGGGCQTKYIAYTKLNSGERQRTAGGKTPFHPRHPPWKSHPLRRKKTKQCIKKVKVKLFRIRGNMIKEQELGQELELEQEARHPEPLIKLIILLSFLWYVQYVSAYGWGPARTSATSATPPTVNVTRRHPASGILHLPFASCHYVPRRRSLCPCLFFS